MGDFDLLRFEVMLESLQKMAEKKWSTLVILEVHGDLSIGVNMWDGYQGYSTIGEFLEACE